MEHLPSIGWASLILLALIGFITFFRQFLALVRIFFVSLTSLRHFPAKYGKGSWVIITGSTDGIGLGFAFELAKLGFNIVLIARNAEKLRKTATLLAARFVIEVIPIQKDFEQSNELDFYREIVEKTQHLDVSMLINNVGTALGGGFLEQRDEDFRKLIHLNCFPVVFMTKFLLPKLLHRHDKRHRSAVINVASITALYPSYRSEVYSASKAYDDLFSRGLAETYRDSNLDVLSVCPCAVSTPLTRYTSQHHAITPEQCANGSLKWLGRSDQTSGHLIHNLQRWAMDLVPQRLMVRYYGREFDRFFQTINAPNPADPKKD